MNAVAASAAEVDRVFVELSTQLENASTFVTVDYLFASLIPRIIPVANDLPPPLEDNTTYLITH